MKLETIQKLCCSFDKADLSLTIVAIDTEGDVLEGILHCTECKRVYPIVSGIPIMSPNEYREFHLEQPLIQQWTKEKVADDFRLIESISDEDQ
jgi:uncharacterized protein YbaR (Trm112 family)